MDVKQQQCMLTYLKYDPGVIDGISGRKTGDAIESFQRDNGLPHDRKWGPQTEEKVRYNFNHDIFRVVQSNTGAQESNTGVQENSTAVQTPKYSVDFWKDIRYFRREEFRCPCGKCGGYPAEPTERLVREAEAMRITLGAEIIIVPPAPNEHSGGSGLRCKAYNATFSNSATNSRHLDGHAIDFSARGKSAETVAAYLESRKRAGKIHYWYQITATSFHMDVD